MVITRFSPTLNGLLHCGHLMNILANEYIAHNVGGKFFVRFDDTTKVATSLGKQMLRYLDAQKKDLEWLEIEIDGWYCQSGIINDVLARMRELHFDPPFETSDVMKLAIPTYVRLGGGFMFYPYVPRQTAERVVMDNMLGVTHVIRGEDFITEYSYYAYLCQIFGFKTPEFVFLPRLSHGGRDISKTNGGFTIAEYRAAGYTAKELKELIARSCLVTPGNGWQLHNIKQNPVLLT